MAQGSPQNTTLYTTNYLRGAIRKWYPDYLHRIQCIPPLYFRRVPYKWESIYRFRVLALASPADSSQAAQSGSGNATQSGEQGQTQHSGDRGQTQQSGASVRASESTQKAQARKSSKKSRKRTHARQPAQFEGESRTLQTQHPGHTTQPESSAGTFEDMSSDVRAELPGSVSSQIAQTGCSSQAGPSGGVSATAQAACSSQAGPSGGVSATAQAAGLSQAGPSGGVSATAQAEGLGETSTQANDKLPKVQVSDLRDDITQQHVLDCFKALGDSREQEGMFIISNLRFRQILTRAADKKLPQGECDIILVNRKHGLCIGEIKSVGFEGTMENKSVDEIKADIVKRVKKAVNQLMKNKSIMEKTVHDVKSGLTVRTTLILPYITRTELQRAVNSDTETLAQDLQKSTGARDIVEATKLCLCSDDMPGVKTLMEELPKNVSSLKTWFTRRFGKAADPLMSDGVYLDLIARLCGPATAIEVHSICKPRLEVHTLPEAVSATGERTTQLVLTPEQIELLNTAPKCAWITGPPGTGKTITAVVMGLVWLKQGFDVDVVSCNRPSLAASEMIYHQMKKTLKCSNYNLSLGESCSAAGISPESAASATDVVADGKPHLLEFDFFKDENNVDEAVRQLREHAGSRGNKLHVIIDECDIPEKENKRARYTRFFSEMIASVSDLHMWVISVDKDHLPTSDKMQAFTMTLPLRCPPTVFRLVETGVNDYDSCYKYSTSVCPSPSDGPPEIRLTHSGTGHCQERDATLCRQCGIDIANKLCQLDVGVTPTGDPSQQTNRPPPLKYGDVMVLSYSSNLTPESEIVAGLESQGLPVGVLPWYGPFPSNAAEKKTIKNVARATLDKVIVAHPFWVKGLERKVVVYLSGRNENDQYEDNMWFTWDKLQIMSRCTAQLIIVLWPGHPMEEN